MGWARWAIQSLTGLRSVFDEPEADDTAEPTNLSQDCGRVLLLHVTVPSPHFNRRISISSGTEDRTDSIGSMRIFYMLVGCVWHDRFDQWPAISRVEARGRDVGRFLVSERTPPWCVSVGSGLIPISPGVVTTSLGKPVSERYPNIRWTEKCHDIYLGRTEPRVE